MCDGFLTAIVCWTAVGHIGLIILQPRMNSSSLAFHLSTYYGQVTSVIDYIMPIMFQNLFHLNVFGIHHQSTCFSVQAMYHMSRTVEMSLTEIFIEDSLYTELALSLIHI